MKRLFRLCAIFLVVFSVVLEGFPLANVYAQEASSSSARTVIPTITQAPEASPSAQTSSNTYGPENPFAEAAPHFDPTQENLGTTITSLINSALTNSSNSSSALIRQKTAFHNLLKKSFRQNEIINV